MTSLYSNARVIAKATTVVRQVTRIQLILQTSGPVDYEMVRQAFKAVLAEDAEDPPQSQPLVAVYVTGPFKPGNLQEYQVDPNNVAHTSDMVDAVNVAIRTIKRNAADTQTFQVFQRGLVDISFLLGVYIDRWIPLQVYRLVSSEYLPVMSVAPRQPG